MCFVELQMAFQVLGSRAKKKAADLVQKPFMLFLLLLLLHCNL